VEDLAPTRYYQSEESPHREVIEKALASGLVLVILEEVSGECLVKKLYAEVEHAVD
jgi:hypothetical protein